jgi:dipeptidase E
VLYVIRDMPGKTEMAAKVLSSDIIYVGGGDTLRMMRAWRKTGLDDVLRQAHEKGVVLAGLSAGSICWFRWGSSDSRKSLHPDAPLMKVAGLGLVRALHCPHYDVEPDRRPHLKALMRKTPGVSIALDNCCGIEIVDADYRIIDSRPSANAYRTFWKSGEYHEELVPKRESFVPLTTLLRR